MSEIETVSAFRDTALRFAKREIAPMLAVEGRDGDLSMLPSIMVKAREAGLAATASPDDPGYEYGVWGRASLTDSAAASLAVLEELASSCAGVAACVHMTGLGAAELDKERGKASVAFFDDALSFDWDLIERPADGSAVLTGSTGAWRLSGAKQFVYSSPGMDSYVVYAAHKGRWARIFLPRDAKGLNETTPGQRIGLSALVATDLKFDQIAIRNEWLMPDRSPAPFVRMSMLGMAAIAVGNARGALDAASAYAAERKQGGVMLEQHGAIRLLIGDARSRIEQCAGFLQSIGERPAGDDANALREAFVAKLRITLDCAQAVTDCLQIFGGYGYMEDYRMEKRLRDAAALKAAVLRPDALRGLCASFASGADR